MILGPMFEESIYPIDRVYKPVIIRVLGNGCYLIIYKRLNHRKGEHVKKLIALVVMASLTTGCSTVMAAKQPPKKNLEMLREGMPRNMLIVEFGQPVSTETKNGKKTDVFSFTQGYGTGAKTARVIGHGLADVATFGLWEIVATPTEATFSGKKMSYEVTYDENNKVEKVVPFQ